MTDRDRLSALARLAAKYRAALHNNRPDVLALAIRLDRACGEVLVADHAGDAAVWEGARELRDARAFQLRLAERIAAASEVLSKVAERKRGAEGAVPRPLFEAAVRVLRLGGATAEDGLVLLPHRPAGESFADAAERVIRRSAACGVTGEESRG